MAKINNSDEANDESLTAEEKLCYSQAFAQRRFKCGKFALQLDCTRQFGHHPLAQTKVKLTPCEGFVYDFYFVEDYGAEFNSWQPLQ